MAMSISNSSQPGVVGGLQPPPGVIPNFVDPWSFGGTIMALSVVGVVTATITTFLRMYTRVFIAKNQGWDDCKSRLPEKIDAWISC